VVSRLFAIVFAIGLLLGASTLQQVVDIQSDLAADSTPAPSVDDLDRPATPIVVPVPDRQLLTSPWTAEVSEGRVHADAVFRPPRSIASR
jgi:hypothetical protein